MSKYYNDQIDSELLSAAFKLYMSGDNGTNYGNTSAGWKDFLFSVQSRLITTGFFEQESPQVSKEYGFRLMNLFEFFNDVEKIEPLIVQFDKKNKPGKSR